MTVEEKFKKASKLEGVLIIIGAVSFICITVFPMLHLGFRNQYGDHKQWQFLTTQQLWLINSTLGLLGGILMNYRKSIISGISGLVTSLVITGFSMIYFSWREQIAIIECVVILGIGIFAGALLYKFLNRMLYPK